MTQVAAAIIRKDGKFLICQRGAGGNCAFLWEFPGGKLEPDETLEECLIRECKEELEIEISVKGIFAETTYKYPEREIAFTFFEAEIIGGELKMNVHNDMQWVLPSELKNYKFCSADVEIMEKLSEMRTIVYSKLVRDKIPEIIELDGSQAICETLTDKYYIEMLDAKLNEELSEYQQDKSLEELADLLEVMRAVVTARGYTWEQLEHVRMEKAEKRGGFQRKILLKEVIEK